MPLIGSYLQPSTLYYLPYLEEELNHFLVGDPAVLGDLNEDIGRLRNPQYQQVTYFSASFWLVYILDYF